MSMLHFWQAITLLLMVAGAYYLGRYDSEYRKRIEAYFKRNGLDK